jgi:hypothetical protein
VLPSSRTTHELVALTDWHFSLSVDADTSAPLHASTCLARHRRAIGAYYSRADPSADHMATGRLWATVCHCAPRTQTAARSAASGRVGIGPPVVLPSAVGLPMSTRQRTWFGGISVSKETARGRSGEQSLSGPSMRRRPGVNYAWSSPIRSRDLPSVRSAVRVRPSSANRSGRTHQVHYARPGIAA